MVSYCCVKNCHNNSSEKRKRSKGIITFHAFPSNPEVRSKWLKAIGRPSWEPPNHARICSAHFTDEQVNREHQRTRLKDDSCPVRYLPANSYFEATEVEVCRICLATDVKMFSLQEEVLKICMKSIVGLNKDIEGLPQFVCYQCSYQLIKCYHLVERSLIAKTTLQNIFAKNGEITKHMVRGVNRAQLNLNSSLTYNIVMPKTTIDLQYDDDLEKYIYTAKSEENMAKREKKNSIIPDKSKKNNNKHNKHKEKASQKEEPKFKIEVDLDLNDDFKIEDTFVQDTTVPDNFVYVNNHVKDDTSNESSVSDDFHIDEDIDTIKHEIDSKIDEKTHEVDEFHDSKVNKKIVRKKKMANKNSNGLTPDEVEMQNHFNIVILTLEQQIQDRELMRESNAYRDALYKCVICYKTYLHPDAYKMHMDNHDPSRGEAECPVCRLRYKNDVLARSHANRTHGKKFYCRTCPKVFNNVRIAKKHQKRHEGYEYKCPLCDFSTLHESAYGAHVRTRHPARHVCGACGHAFASERGRTLHARRAHPATAAIQDPPAASEALFRCVECDVRFNSEGAWRVHMLTSTQHKRKRDPCDPTPLPDQLKCTCPRCGEQFGTAKQLQQHSSEQHGGKTKKTAWRLPGDHYPAGCEHCGETVNNRKEHYFHVRKMHPKQRASYQPVITAVCDTCGKGFQNSTKLHLHELRHRGVGTVRCPHCPRLFFDKYQLARHIGVHSDARPYACTLCDKAFKLRSNLDRHAKVHSGATPYECTMCGKRFRYSSSRNLHVRTVHYKLPHPPRTRKKNNNT